MNIKHAYIGQRASYSGSDIDDDYFNLRSKTVIKGIDYEDNSITICDSVDCYSYPAEEIHPVKRIFKPFKFKGKRK